MPAHAFLPHRPPLQRLRGLRLPRVPQRPPHRQLQRGLLRLPLVAHERREVLRLHRRQPLFILHPDRQRSRPMLRLTHLRPRPDRSMSKMIILGFNLLKLLLLTARTREFLMAKSVMMPMAPLRCKKLPLMKKTGKWKPQRVMR